MRSWWRGSPRVGLFDWVRETFACGVCERGGCDSRADNGWWGYRPRIENLSAVEQRRDSICIALCIAFPYFQEAADVVRLKHEQAEQIGARGLPRAEAASEMPEEPGELGFEVP